MCNKHIQLDSNRGHIASAQDKILTIYMLHAQHMYTLAFRWNQWANDWFSWISACLRVALPLPKYQEAYMYNNPALKTSLLLQPHLWGLIKISKEQSYSHLLSMLYQIGSYVEREDARESILPGQNVNQSAPESSGEEGEARDHTTCMKHALRPCKHAQFCLCTGIQSIQALTPAGSCQYTGGSSTRTALTWWGMLEFLHFRSGFENGRERICILSLRKGIKLLDVDLRADKSVLREAPLARVKLD